MHLFSSECNKISKTCNFLFSDGMPCVELVVHGIPPSYPRDPLLKAFEQFGRVEQIKAISGMVVLVHMKDPEAADRALGHLNGATLEGGHTVMVVKSDHQQIRSRPRFDRIKCKGHQLVRAHRL